MAAILKSKMVVSGNDIVRFILFYDNLHLTISMQFVLHRFVLVILDSGKKA